MRKEGNGERKGKKTQCLLMQAHLPALWMSMQLDRAQARETHTPKEPYWFLFHSAWMGRPWSHYGSCEDILVHSHVDYGLGGLIWGVGRDQSSRWQWRRTREERRRKGEEKRHVMETSLSFLPPFFGVYLLFVFSFSKQDGDKGLCE